jgi:hypothetical protein
MQSGISDTNPEAEQVQIALLCQAGMARRVELAAVEVRSWRAAYRGLMRDAFLSGLSEAEKATGWRQNLLKHGPSGRKRVYVALSDAGISGFIRVGSLIDEALLY